MFRWTEGSFCVELLKWLKCSIPLDGGDDDGLTCGLQLVVHGTYLTSWGFHPGFPTLGSTSSRN